MSIFADVIYKLKKMKFIAINHVYFLYFLLHTTLIFIIFIYRYL